MRFNDREDRVEIVFEGFDSMEERRFIKTAFEMIKSQAHFNKCIVELSRNVVLKEP